MFSASGSHVQLHVSIVEVVGHSFPRRLDKFLLTTHYDLLNLSQANLIWRYREGMIIPNLGVFESQWLNGRPDVIVIDIGSNDMASLNGPDPHQMAVDLILRSDRIQRVISCEVVFVEQTFRVLPNPEVMRRVNGRIDSFNQYLFRMTPSMRGMTFFRHRNLAKNWRTFICQDGVHLTADGMKRYARSCRGINIQAPGRVQSRRYFQS